MGIVFLHRGRRLDGRMQEVLSPYYRLVLLAFWLLNSVGCKRLILFVHSRRPAVQILPQLYDLFTVQLLHLPFLLYCC